MGSILAGWGIGMLVLSMATPGSADWNVYVAPGVGISGATVDTNGQASTAPVTRLTGMDNDSSPLIDVAVGLEVPMDELVPREWLLDVRLPDWPVRFEAEAAFLRQYDFRTVAGGEVFFTDYEATATLMFNSWLDIPMVAVYRPVQYTFGLGRQPRVRRWLEPASIYVGAGVGFAALKIDGTSNVLFGDDDPIDFAWNVGIGINYALTRNVSLSAGYRYVGLGKRKIDLTGGVSGPNDEVEFDPQAHELRVGIRIRVFDFLSPWR